MFPIAKFVVETSRVNLSAVKFVRSSASSVRDGRQRREDGSTHNNKSLHKFLTCTAAGLAAGYLLVGWNERKHDVLQSLLLPVKAKSVSGSDYRKRFNFIADIVEKTSSGVVTLEVFDKKHVDLITGKPFVINGGSGLIVDSNGLILTNAHIVHKPNIKVVVKLFNGDVTEGVIEAIDYRADLATIRINRKNLPTMQFGDSDDLRTGEFVVAMGSPLTLVNSVTSGVISNPGRHSYELKLFKVNMMYIQTDAAVTFGNSGGPLINLDGEVIGINVLQFTTGISFAVPINYVKKFLQSIEDTRKGQNIDGIRVLSDDATNTRRKFLGITMLSLTPDLLHQLREHGTNFPKSLNHGIFIWKVFRGSPAELDGVRPGDIITHINEQPALSSDDIYRALKMDSSFFIRVIREGQELNIKVTPRDI